MGAGLEISNVRVTEQGVTIFAQASELEGVRVNPRAKEKLDGLFLPAKDPATKARNTVIADAIVNLYANRKSNGYHQLLDPSAELSVNGLMTTKRWDLEMDKGLAGFYYNDFNDDLDGIEFEIDGFKLKILGPNVTELFLSDAIDRLGEKGAVRGGFRTYAETQKPIDEAQPTVVAAQQSVR